MSEEEIKKQYYANGIINVTNKKSEEEIKRQYANRIVNADEVIKSLIDKFKTDKTSVDIQQLQLMAEYLICKADKLQKENKELKEDNSHQWKERCRLTFELGKLQKENQELKDINVELNTDIGSMQTTIQELKEENIILEGNKIGYKLAIQELEKTIDLIIDDFQMENYFVGMTNKEVREYYKKRKELKE